MKTKTKALLIILLISLVMLSGCGTTYNHLTKSTKEFKVDDKSCQAQAGQTCGNIFGGKATLGKWTCQQKIYQACILGKGWYEPIH